jgi:hypothetical protein
MNIIGLVRASAVVMLLVPAGAFAQQDGPRRPGRGGAPGVSPAEVQRLFDAYEVMQAQQALQLTDEQSPQFLARVKTLQDVRRRSVGERARILAELRRLSAGSAGSEEGEIRAQLKALDDLEARTLNDVKQAMDGLNQVLDTRQQARFRLLEEQMERRKLELLMRARQANRPRNQF